jgi:DNA-binding SARP family transcriptional activator
VVTEKSAPYSAPSFRVQLLGPLALERNNVAIEVGRWQPRVATLFKLLATAPRYRRSRDEIADVLWPEAAPEAGSANLRLLVHRLRLALGGGDPSPILSEHGWVTLNPACGWEVDLPKFEKLTVGAGRDIPSLTAAAELYRGEPLPEDRYEDWAVPIREGAQRKWREVCLRLARFQRARGAQADAASWLERLLESDPLDEEAVQELLSILNDLGRRTEALRRYRQFEQRLTEEMDVPPEPETLAMVAHLEDYLNQAARRPAQEEELFRALPVTPHYPLVAAGPLVGREPELAAILRAMPAGSDDHPRLLLIAAEAGMGKTRMLAEVASRAREAGMLTLAGGCYEQESRLPYGPIHDALADYVRLQPEPVLRAQLTDFQPELSQIVPELRTRLAGFEETVSPEAEDQRLALFTTVSLALERISRDRPLVLLLDDLHWADSATLQLLHFLLRQPSLDRALIVGAYREEEVSPDSTIRVLEAELRAAAGHDGSPRVAGRRGAQQADGRPVGAALPRAGAELRGPAEDGGPPTGWCPVISLAPLKQSELRAILEGRLGGRCEDGLVESLHTRSGGNPFFAVQMLRLLEQERQLEEGEGGWHLAGSAAIELPPEVRETVARRLRRLEADEQEVLTLGSVLGREFAFASLEALWDGNERSLFASLDAGQNSYLLGETDRGYRFRHPLLREVVYGRIPAQRKSRLHRRAGLALETLYGDRSHEHAAELAWHSLHGKNPEQALRYSILAGDQAASLYAYSEAEQHYRTALSLLKDTQEGRPHGQAQGHGPYGAAPTAPNSAASAVSGGENVRLEAQVLEKLGALLKIVGRYGEAIEVLDRAAEWYSTCGDHEGQRMAVAQIGRVQLAAGALDEGIARVKSALACLGSGTPSPGLATLNLSLAFLSFGHGQYADQLEAAERASELASSIGDDRLLVEAELARAYALPFMGRSTDFGQALEDVIQLAEKIGDLTTLCRALCALGPYYVEKGEVGKATRYLGRALELVERLGDRSRIALVTCTTGRVAFWCGEWNKARALYERSLSMYQELNARADTMIPLHGLGEVAMCRGEWETGVRYLQEHIAVAESTGDFRWLHLIHVLFAERDLLEGRPESARKRIEQHREHLELTEDTVLAALLVLARAHLDMGELERAQHIVGDAVRQARESDIRMILAEALRVQGVVLSRRGNWEEAEASFREALTLAEAISCPYAAGRTLYEYGVMLLGAGSSEAARSRLEEALTIFRRLGARPYLELTEGALKVSLVDSSP